MRTQTGDMATERPIPAVHTLNHARNYIAIYTFDQVREKLLLDGRLPAIKVDEAIAEFRKYLSLIALGHQGLGMISADIDEVWHTFILFTREYSEFCHRAFGYYLHHQPGIPSKPLGKMPRRRFLQAYRTEFGELPAIWSAESNACWGTCSTPSTNCQDSKCR